MRPICCETSTTQNVIGISNKLKNKKKSLKRSKIFHTKNIATCLMTSVSWSREIFDHVAALRSAKNIVSYFCSLLFTCKISPILIVVPSLPNINFMSGNAFVSSFIEIRLLYYTMSSWMGHAICIMHIARDRWIRDFDL